MRTQRLFWKGFEIVATQTDELLSRSLAAQPECAYFWNAAKQRRFMLPKCADCNRVHWYPRTFCPLCYSPNIAWIDASGRATAYAFTALVRQKDAPVVAYVALEEGPLMLTNIVGAALGEISIGAKLKVDFVPLGQENLLPVFRLETAG